MKVVLDTNVFISGLLQPKGVPGRIVQAWRQSQYILVVSDSMLSEIERVLNYPKIQRRLHWSPEQVERYISLLRFYAEVVPIEDVLQTIPDGLLRDIKDNPILATFIAGRGDWLVSGDDHLHAVRDQYSVCSPVDFLPMLGPQMGQ